MPRKVYLGDGAYASFDGFAWEITAENGIVATDRVVLEPEAMANLLDFIHARAPNFLPAHLRRMGFDVKEGP